MRQKSKGSGSEPTATTGRMKIASTGGTMAGLKIKMSGGSGIVIGFTGTGVKYSKIEEWELERD